jgi:hypothetical protein
VRQGKPSQRTRAGPLHPGALRPRHHQTEYYHAQHSYPVSSLSFALGHHSVRPVPLRHAEHRGHTQSDSVAESGCTRRPSERRAARLSAGNPGRTVGLELPSCGGRTSETFAPEAVLPKCSAAFLFFATAAGRLRARAGCWHVRTRASWKAEDGPAPSGGAPGRSSRAAGAYSVTTARPRRSRSGCSSGSAPRKAR